MYKVRTYEEAVRLVAVLEKETGAGLVGRDFVNTAFPYDSADPLVLFVKDKTIKYKRFSELKEKHKYSAAEYVFSFDEVTKELLKNTYLTRYKGLAPKLYFENTGIDYVSVILSDFDVCVSALDLHDFKSNLVEAYGETKSALILQGVKSGRNYFNLFKFYLDVNDNLVLGSRVFYHDNLYRKIRHEDRVNSDYVKAAGMVWLDDGKFYVGGNSGILGKGCEGLEDVIVARIEQGDFIVYGNM